MPCARHETAKLDKRAIPKKITAEKSLLRDMAKRIAHQVGAGRSRAARKVSCGRRFGLGRSKRTSLDEENLEKVYISLSIFIEMQGKVVLQQTQIPGGQRRSLEGSIAG